MSYQLHKGDCLDILPTLEENSVDTVITDGPYGLKFMGKNWDHGIPGVRFWREILRVAKPGAFLLAFGGTRTWHRLAVAIEDAGWEIRDTVMWLQGQGFPKGHDYAKAIQEKFLQEFLQDVSRLNHTNGDSQYDYSYSCRRCGEQLHGGLDIAQDVELLLTDAPKRSHLYEPLRKILRGNGHKYTAFSCGLFSHLSRLDCRDRIASYAWQLLLEVSSFLCLSCFVQLVWDGFSRAEQQGDIDWSNIDAYNVVSAWAMSEKFFHSVRMSPEPYNHYITTAPNPDSSASSSASEKART